MTTTELLEKYDKVTRETDRERALYILLKANEKNITGLIEHDKTGYWFHKAFRQTDVCEKSYIDNAIYVLLGESSLFWEILGDVS